MNERIKELAEQAGATHKQNLGVYQFYTVELEKFVELIVRECASVVDNKQYNHSTSHITGHCSEAIKNNFGIK